MNKNLIRLSRNRNFLIRSSFLIIVFSILLGSIIQKLSPQKSDTIKREVVNAFPWMNSTQLNKSIEQLGYDKIINIISYKEGPIFTKNEISNAEKYGFEIVSLEIGD